MDLIFIWITSSIVTNRYHVNYLDYFVVFGAKYELNMALNIYKLDSLNSRGERFCGSILPLRAEGYCCDDIDWPECTDQNAQPLPPPPSPIMKSQTLIMLRDDVKFRQIVAKCHFDVVLVGGDWNLKQ